LISGSIIVLTNAVPFSPVFLPLALVHFAVGLFRDPETFFEPEFVLTPVLEIVLCGHSAAPFELVIH
jgi:hypothetical protein